MAPASTCCRFNERSAESGLGEMVKLKEAVFAIGGPKDVAVTTIVLDPAPAPLLFTTRVTKTGALPRGLNTFDGEKLHVAPALIADPEQESMIAAANGPAAVTLNISGALEPPIGTVIEEGRTLVRLKSTTFKSNGSENEIPKRSCPVALMEKA